MAAEGKRSKGRFLYLFDWNAKSHKKLFSNKSESFDAEGSSEGKESVDSLAIPQYLLQELSERGDHSSFRENGNYSNASSLYGDDGYTTKAPGVVARLMGLDSMPTTSSCELSSFASYESHAYPRGATLSELEQHNMRYGYAPTKVEGFSMNPANSRMIKAHGRPLERFQTEGLPPKSAKTISITHHKLLSPIKSPGFVPTKDAASIMEAAARITDPAPQPSGRVKMPTLGSLSSSFRIQDLKDKMDGAQRSSRLLESSKTPKTPAPIQQGRGTSDRSSRKSLFKNIMSSPPSSSVKDKNKGKAIPLAAQDRANVRKKDSSVSRDGQKRLQKEHKKLKQKEPITLVGPSRTPKKKSSGVLRQNNEKQNIVAPKDQSTAKSSASDQQPRKISHGDNYAGPSKIVSKVFVSAENGSKKVVTTSVVDQRHALNGVSKRRPPMNGVTEKRLSRKSSNERRPSLNRLNNISRSKQFAAKDNRLGEKVMENSNESAAQHDISLQGNPRRDMDVISFTFTSPIKKAGSQSSSTSEAIQNLSADSCDNAQLNASFSSPSQGLSSTLSLLLEQKIRELTDKIGPTTSDVIMKGPDANIASCLSESLVSDAAHSLMCYDDWSDRDQASVTCDDDCSSSMVTKSSHYWEDVDGVEEQSLRSNNIFQINGESHLNIPAPECSMSESQISSTTSDVTYGNGQPSSPLSHEVTSCVSSESVHPREDDSDYMNASSYWELEYMRCILHYAGLKRLRLDEDYKNIDPGLFDLLENLINSGSSRNEEPCSKLERKILFDCVSESVHGKCQRAFFGSYKSWVKWGMLLQNEWLTEEIYKEVLSWQNMGFLMVDELVDLDMSTQYGRWVDYELESLEEGLDIEKEIVESLIDELIVDLPV